MTSVPPLPWQAGQPPLMLAPMQGLTNRAMRRLFIDWARPDTVFTEFMRVNAAAPVRRLSAADLREIAPQEDGVPLVVQLIGHGCEALVSAARSAQAAGAVHINLNLGCPYGRMTSGLTGGGMLQRPELLEEIFFALRGTISGSFSVKLRAGYDDPNQIFGLLPLFEAAGVDFLVLHPRTVVQEYQGLADHAITAQVVRQTRLPVIANGDIRTAADGARLLEESGAAGLMLGRGAIADPLLFQRLRGSAPAEPTRSERAAMLQRYLGELLARYGELFCGETQVLSKVKGVLATFDDADFEHDIRQLRKARTMAAFSARLAELE
ncbi:tRNA-dihydrouridine synthase [Geobacter sp. AOG2]|uniref:tRNA dihydrouridine synthase n=1 Tax=Geobacter sp. AOG2 TaxID=1566347 RepID=UPI001CC4FF80|nr:tRNA-dihydrouridine synthase family protein [Geobacter sp. AOG2]